MNVTKALFVSLLLAGASAACLFLYMKRFEAETSGGPKSGVLMATRDIRMGEKLDRSMLGVRHIPRAYLEPRHIALEELQAVLGARMSMSVNASEAVLWSDLASMQSERRDLSGLIEPGMRALTVHSTGSGMFSGLLRPGDRVDVLYTGKGKSGMSATVTLLQNLLVLAVGSNTGGSNQRRTRARGVTVSVSPEQAQAVIHARKNGKLDVALRNPDDNLVLDGLPETEHRALSEPDVRMRLSHRVRRAAAISQAVNTEPEKRHAIERVRSR